MIIRKPQIACVLWLMSIALSSDVIANPTENSQVAAYVEKEMERDEVLARDKISATSEAGTVTLSGTVETLFAKRRAVEVAKQVRGVSSVIDQIILRARELDDETIAACVRRTLTVDPVLEKSEIIVSVNSGEVGIVGKVSSLTEKQIAETVVSEIDGVTSVINQLTVASTGDRPDSELEAEIKALINNSTELAGSQISVNVSDGLAELSGTVTTAWQKDRSAQLASLPGVERVSAEAVSVDSQKAAPHRRERPVTVDDESIRNAVVLALRHDPVTLSYTEDIDVQVERGNVTLNGTVERVRAMRAAEEAATNTVGVRGVANHLEVAWTGEKVDDATIIDEAQAAIRRNAYLQRHEIRVHCHDAHLHLYGLVDSEFEKRLATWTCDGLKGVVHVGNMLAVAPEWQSKPDAEIKSDLQTKLKQILVATGASIDVDVKNGVAILRGEVTTWPQWQAALEAAIEAGARSPHNLIRVKGHPAHNGKSLFVP